MTTLRRNATISDSLSVVRAYYRAWTTKDYHTARDLLDPLCWIEVPINHYDSAAEFMDAVTAFGDATVGVDLLGEFTAGDEAMLLYDMNVAGIGELRVAEHFTVSNGRIIRIRQIHDTMPIHNAKRAFES